MLFQPNEMQAELLGALDKLLAPAQAAPLDSQRAGYDHGLDAALAESGLLDAAGIEEFGPVAAALLTERVCRLPLAVEVGASALLRPLLCPDLPRPISVIEGRPDRPARFLPQARAVLFLGPDAAWAAPLQDGDVVALPAFYAYPMGRLNDPDAVAARAVMLAVTGADTGADAQVARRLHRAALACEIAGALAGALDAVLDHVRSRRQFGRPVGSFQAVQHRLAAGASRIGAGRLLALRAASAAHTEDPALALGYLQDAAPAILYDLHQFMGAMGLTLEHPLYRWSYRVKLLLSELGGASTQLSAAADAVWGD